LPPAYAVRVWHFSRQTIQSQMGIRCGTGVQTFWMCFDDPGASQKFGAEQQCGC